jgi:tRNA(His) 5'-end guanylyltransferase
MPPLRGIGVVAKTEDKRQIEAVRAQLRSEAFWTRRRRRSLGRARASGEASRGSSHSGTEDGAEASILPR